MKENIKDALFLFGIAIILWLLSVGITYPIIAWILKWAFKIGAVLFVIGGIIAIINLIVSYCENRNKNKDDNNKSNTQ